MTARTTPSLVALAALLATLVVGASAKADSLPPQDCDGMSDGDPCSNAGKMANEDGTCLTETCSTLNYSCDAGPDSGHSGPCGTVSSSCLLCELPKAGSGSGSSVGSGSGSGSGSAKGSGSGSSKTGSGTGGEKLADGGTTPANSSSSCAAVPVGSGTPGAALLFGIGGLALALASRRRKG
jgi:hypothetical protein